MGVNDKPKATANPTQEIQLVHFREEGKWAFDYCDLYWADVKCCVILCRREKCLVCWALVPCFPHLVFNTECKQTTLHALQEKHFHEASSLWEGFWEPPRCADTDDDMIWTLQVSVNKLLETGSSKLNDSDAFAVLRQNVMNCVVCACTTVKRVAWHINVYHQTGIFFKLLFTKRVLQKFDYNFGAQRTLLHLFHWYPPFKFYLICIDLSCTFISRHHTSEHTQKWLLKWWFKNNGCTLAHEWLIPFCEYKHPGYGWVKYWWHKGNELFLNLVLFW